MLNNKTITSSHCSVQHEFSHLEQLERENKDLHIEILHLRKALEDAQKIIEYCKQINDTCLQYINEKGENTMKH